MVANQIAERNIVGDDSANLLQFIWLPIFILTKLSTMFAHGQPQRLYTPPPFEGFKP